jgi:hypothetical protein
VLNQGYGWAGEVNLSLIFDRIFSVERGAGYPAHRREPQQTAIRSLETISKATHYSFAEIIKRLPDDVLLPALNYPGVMEIIDLPALSDSELQEAMSIRLENK